MNHDNTDLDILFLYKENLKHLTIEEKEVSLSNPDVDKALLHPFLVGEEIPLLAKEDYVSPFLVHDIVKNIYYPLFYFHLEKKSHGLVRKDELPCINQAGVMFLRENQIELRDEFSLKDIPTCYQSLQNSLSSRMKMDKVGLVPYFSFASSQILSDSLNHPFLSRYLFGNDDELQKYDSLFKEIKSKPVEKEICHDSFGYFARLQRVLKREEIYQGTKVSFSTDSLRECFMLQFIFRNLKNHETSLLILPSLEDVSFESSFLEGCLRWKEFSKEEILSQLRKKEPKGLSLTENRFLKDTYQTERKHISFFEKKKECYSLLSSYLNVENLSEFKPDKATLDLNLASYDEKQFSLDKVFFDTFRKLDSIRRTHLSDHPYYGLTMPNKKESYDRLQLLLSQLIQSLESFLTDIEKNELFSKYDIDIRSLEDFRRYYEIGHLLSQYNGFPRKYFRIDEKKEEEYSLLSLKKAYQSLSSSRLFLKNVFDEKFFSLDLYKLIRRLDSKNPFLRHLSRLQVRRHLQLEDEYDLEQIIRVIKAYCQSKSRLEDILPLYVEVYGESVMTMNGVVEIEANIAYVNKVKEYQRNHDFFSLELPFVKRMLKDKAFRLDSLARLDGLYQSYEEILSFLQEYEQDYLESDLSYLTSMSFSDLKARFSKETQYQYDDFDQYLEFQDAKKSASTLLNVVIQRYAKAGRRLDTLQEDFFSSIVYQSYQNGKRKFAPFRADYCTIRKSFVSSLSKERNVVDFSLANLCLENRMYVEDLDLRERITDRLLEKGTSFGYQDYMDGLHMLSHDYPIVIVRENELYSMPDDMFDHAIIYDSDMLSSMALLSAYRVSRKRIFLYDENHHDRRIVGYHESVIHAEMISSLLGDFSLLPDSLLEALKKDCEKHGTVLRTDDERFPLIIPFHGRDYAIYPDVLSKKDESPYSMVELGKYYALFENLTLIAVDTYGYLLGDEDLFGLME